MQLTPTMHRCVLHWGEMASRWGVSRSVAQIHALLFLAPAPLTADEIAETLNVARSNVSVSIKELQAWDLVSVTHQLGDRRDYFQARKDIWEVLTMIMDGRKKREIDPTLQMLREATADAGQGSGNPRTGETAHRQHARVPGRGVELVRPDPRHAQPTLLKLMRMGTKVAKIVT